MPGFDDIFGGFDDIVDENPKNDEEKSDEWDTGKDSGVWDSGEKENIWRTSAPAAPGDAWATAPDQIDPCAGGCDECEAYSEDCDDPQEVPENTPTTPFPQDTQEETEEVEQKSEFDQMEEYDTEYAEDDFGDEDGHLESVFDDI